MDSYLFLGLYLFFKHLEKSNNLSIFSGNPCINLYQLSVTFCHAKADRLLQLFSRFSSHPILSCRFIPDANPPGRDHSGVTLPPTRFIEQERRRFIEHANPGRERVLEYFTKNEHMCAKPKDKH